MAANRVTKKWLQNHFHYSWWKYLVIVAVSIMGIDMLFTSTAYRVPEDKKLELYICSGYIDSMALENALWPQYQARYPEQEELTVMNIDLSSGDMYANMQFTTYAAAQQGDVLLLPQAEVYKYAAEGADEFFMELTPYVENGVINLQDIDPGAGMLKNAEGETGLYAIPADSLYGLSAFYGVPAGSMLCATSYSGNDEHAAGLMNLMIELYKTEKPESQNGTVEAPVTIFN